MRVWPVPVRGSRSSKEARMMNSWVLISRKAALFRFLRFRSPSCTISEVLSQRCGATSGFSQRHFIELFRQETGLSPKRFCRVKRFQQVIQAVQGHHQVDWADIAVAFQYHDQAQYRPSQLD